MENSLYLLLKNAGPIEDIHDLVDRDVNLAMTMRLDTHHRTYMYIFWLNFVEPDNEIVYATALASRGMMCPLCILAIKKKNSRPLLTCCQLHIKNHETYSVLLRVFPRELALLTCEFIIKPGNGMLRVDEY